MDFSSLKSIEEQDKYNLSFLFKLYQFKPKNLTLKNCFAVAENRSQNKRNSCDITVFVYDLKWQIFHNFELSQSKGDS